MLTMLGRPLPLGIIQEADTEGLKATVLLAALELDVFNTIAAGHRTLPAIASATGSSPRGMAILLNALCPLGLLHKEEDCYALTALAATFLVRGQPTYCADIYHAWWKGRERLVESIRTGTAAMNLAAPAETAELWASYAAPALLNWPLDVATIRARWAEVGLSPAALPGPQILDIGCGAGCISFVRAQDDPAARVTGLDSSPVLAIAAGVAELMGVAGQVTLRPGALPALEVPAGAYDVVLFGRILWYFNPHQVGRVLQQAWEALKAGGVVLIVSGVGDEGRCQAEAPLLSAVELFNASPFAEVYTFSEYQALLEGAGFRAITLHSERWLTARKAA